MVKVTDYSALSPDLILDAIESLGGYTDGRSLALNSYENRVYQVGIDQEQPVIAKFYRPERWSDEQIQEEHDFSQELADAELPVVAPTRIDGKSLFEYEGYRFAIYPRQGGREPNLDDPDNLLQLGRFLGRMHAVGAKRAFSTRPTITPQNFGHDSVQLISEQFVPKNLKEVYDSVCRDLMQAVEERWSLYGDAALIRCHGDCHVGNILWRDDSPHFVDFDDARQSFAVQDIWLTLSGERHEQEMQLCELIEGYNEFYDFHPRELQLVEALRTLRIIHYAAWLARRWDDPAFPKAFPWFNTDRYWGEHILELREQMAAMDEAPLRLL